MVIWVRDVLMPSSMIPCGIGIIELDDRAKYILTVLCAAPPRLVRPEVVVAFTGCIATAHLRRSVPITGSALQQVGEEKTECNPHKMLRFFVSLCLVPPFLFPCSIYRFQ